MQNLLERPFIVVRDLITTSSPQPLSDMAKNDGRVLLDKFCNPNKRIHNRGINPNKIKKTVPRLKGIGGIVAYT